MRTVSVFGLIFLGLAALSLARVMDDCCDFQHLTEHSIDMSVDYRDAVTQYNSDTCRFKRNMRIGQNKNPNANKFFVIYKSAMGLNCFYHRLYFIENTSEESHYFSSNDGINYVELNENQMVKGPKTMSGDNWYYYDIWFVNLPERTHFIRLQFKDWVNEGWINYWSPQISMVSFFEAGDPICGDNVCSSNDTIGRPEDCHSCPQDCGACPTPDCGNGVCEYGETWAPRVGEHATDLGYITCPEDCGDMYACGNERQDPGEVCGAQTQQSCGEDACGLTRYDYYEGECGNGGCDGSETCASCPGDCGVCPQCGDGQCNGLETCSSCEADCGECVELYNATCVYPVPLTQDVPPPPYVPPTPVDPTFVLPGIIEVENYLSGGQNVGYYDTTPGNTGGAFRTDDVDILACTDGPAPCYAVGYFEAGEWLQFNVEVAQTGPYNVQARYVSPDGIPRLLDVHIDGEQVAQLMLPPTGSWITWGTSANFATVVPLTAGNHVLRLQSQQAYWTLNWVQFSIAPPVAPTPPVPPVPVAPPTSPEPVAEPVAEPVVEPVASPVAEPVQAPVAEPVSEPVANPPVDEPVSRPTSTPREGPSPSIVVREPTARGLVSAARGLAATAWSLMGVALVLLV